MVKSMCSTLRQKRIWQTYSQNHCQMRFLYLCNKPLGQEKLYNEMTLNCKCVKFVGSQGAAAVHAHKLVRRARTPTGKREFLVTKFKQHMLLWKIPGPDQGLFLGMSRCACAMAKSRHRPTWSRKAYLDVTPFSHNLDRFTSYCLSVKAQPN